MEARGTDAGRDAIVVGRQLGVVLLEHVQPLGSPLYGIVSAAELVVPLSARGRQSLRRPRRASGGAARRAVRSPRSALGTCRSTSGRTWQGSCSSRVLAHRRQGAAPGLQVAAHCLWAAPALGSVSSSASALHLLLRRSCPYTAFPERARPILQAAGCQGILRPAAAHEDF
jgi:hypothetical protein